MAAAAALAEEPPVPAPAAVPTGALAVLTLKESIGSLARLAAFCDKGMLNTGGLASKAVSNYLFQLVPLNEGLDAQRPARILWLGPELAPDGESAYMLSLSDAKAFKKNIVEAFGAEEADGLLHASVMQGMGKADTELWLKVDEKSALIASSKKALTALAEMAKSLPEPAADAPDTALQLDVAALQAAYGPVALKELAHLSKSLGLGGNAEQLQARIGKVAEQLETISVQVRFGDEGLRLRVEAHAKAESTLAKFWVEGLNVQAVGKNKPLPRDAVLFVETPAWHLGLLDARLRELAKQMPQLGEKGVAALDASAQSLEALLKATTGELEFALAAPPEGGATLLVGLAAKEPEPAQKALQDFLAKIFTSSAHVLRAALDGKDDLPPPYELKAVTHEKREELELTFAQEGFVEKNEKAFIEAALGWPVEIALLNTKTLVLAACGKQRLEALEGAAKSAEGKAEDAETAAELARVCTGAGPGTTATVMLKPVGLVRFLLGLNSMTPREAADLTRRVSDGPIFIQTATSKGMASLEVRLPPAAVAGVIQLGFRIAASGVHIEMPFGEKPKPAPKNVPAPPPAEPK